MNSLLILGFFSCLVVVLTESTDKKHVTLNNGNKMPSLGLGTGKSRSSSLEQALDVALESGYRLIDTATLYENEQTIGHVLNRWFTSGKVNRSEIFVVTKLPPTAMRAGDVPRFLKKSLQNLQLEYVDMYLIHIPCGLQNVGDETLWPADSDGRYLADVTTDHLAIWKAMEEQVDAGLTKSIGLSNFNETQISRILAKCRIPPANLQIELHVDFQQNSLVEYCKNNNIAVTAYAPLGSPRPESPNLLNNEVVSEIATKHNKSSAQILLRYIVQREVIAIPKSTTPSRIQQNIDIFDFELDAEDVEKLNALEKGNSARVYDFKFFKGVEDHPEFPFRGE